MKNNKGITLIALVITIIVMLILVGVSINTAMSGGLFNKAKEAKQGTIAARDSELALSEGQIVVDGITYQSIDAFLAGEEGEITDWDALLEGKTSPHKDQRNSDDIGVVTDGQLVNLDLWTYEVVTSSRGQDDAIRLKNASKEEPGYSNDDIAKGKIQGTVPQYIKISESDNFLPVVSMVRTFQNCTNLEIAPEIPSTVRVMEWTFANCTELTTPPKIPNGVTSMIGTFATCTQLGEMPSIPNSVTNMENTFSSCTSLTKTSTIPASVQNMDSTFLGCTRLEIAPQIPNSVKTMIGTFEECTNLTTAPTIPSSVINLGNTFYHCSALTGSLVINVNPDAMKNIDMCLYNAVTAEGAELWISGEAGNDFLEDIAETGGENENIHVGTQPPPEKANSK